MKIITRLTLILWMTLISFNAAPAKEWRGLVPLKSTRAEVERLLGPAKAETLTTYYLPEEIVYVQFAANPGCREKWPYESWDVSRDTVTTIGVTLRKPIPLADLGIDVAKFKKVQGDYDVEGHFYYVNSEDGFTIELNSLPDGKGDFVRGYIYRPTARDSHLRCRSHSDEEEKLKDGCLLLGLRIDCSSEEVRLGKTVECKVRFDSMPLSARRVLKWTVTTGGIISCESAESVTITLVDPTVETLSVRVKVKQPNLCFDEASFEFQVMKPSKRASRKRH